MPRMPNWSSLNKRTYEEQDFTSVVGENYNLTKYKFMQGYRTWLGILLTILGALGWGDLISDGQVTQSIDAITQIVGIALAIYGNFKAHQAIKAAGAYK